MSEIITRENFKRAVAGLLDTVRAQDYIRADIVVRQGDDPNSIIIENFPLPVTEYVLRFTLTPEQAETFKASVAEEGAR